MAPKSSKKSPQEETFQATLTIIKASRLDSGRWALQGILRIAVYPAPAIKMVFSEVVEESTYKRLSNISKRRD